LFHQFLSTSLKERRKLKEIEFLDPRKKIILSFGWRAIEKWRGIARHWEALALNLKIWTFRFQISYMKSLKICSVLYIREGNLGGKR